jgi:hypothetical protein
LNRHELTLFRDRLCHFCEHQQYFKSSNPVIKYGFSPQICFTVLLNEHVYSNIIGRVRASWYKLNGRHHILAVCTFLGHVTSMRLRPLAGPIKDLKDFSRGSNSHVLGTQIQKYSGGKLQKCSEMSRHTISRALRSCLRIDTHRISPLDRKKIPTAAMSLP